MSADIPRSYPDRQLGHGRENVLTVVKNFIIWQNTFLDAIAGVLNPPKGDINPIVFGLFPNINSPHVEALNICGPIRLFVNT